ncbi:MAG: DUF1015 domain-containing protein [Firmicutes bacterium]|nr:DUF1015 domain-containing protein [Bacillota bacterium]
MNIPCKAAQFLLPEKKVDLQKWAVIACDQHTSDLSYWQKLTAYVGGAPSTLNLIFPEAYLAEGKDAGENRAKKIAAQMNDYLNSGIFCAYEGMVLVERLVSNGKTRTGILLAVDLEQYEYKAGTKPLIRASEGTVLERIPPRTAVRRRCPLELPHIMLLYDDPNGTVLAAARQAKPKPVLYDFTLNFGGGKIRGTHLKNTAPVLSAFEALQSSSRARCGEELLFAVGDGNHSLAAAKQCYEEAKAQGHGEECRFALCEAVNLYDDALQFEPIHRLVFTDNPAQFAAEIAKNMPVDPIEAVAYTDAYISKAGLEADYIHGEENLLKLAAQQNAAPVLLKPMDKAGFFPYIVQNGSLPKKTFSMGEAEDKRYYIEAATING